MVCGKMVAIVYMFVCHVIGICYELQSLWLLIRLMIVWLSSLAAIMAQCMGSRVELWSLNKASPTPNQRDDFVCPMEPNNMFLLWGELYCVSCVGHVRGDE